MAQKKFRLTVQEQIIVHLFNFKDFDEQVLEVPFGVTQEGVAMAIGVVRSAIPRAVKRLVEKGYVKESIAHITDLTRRRKVYFLNLDGLVEARRLTDNLKKIEIKIPASEGTGEDIKILLVSKVNNELDTDYSLLEIIRHLSPEYILDIEELRRSSSQTPSSPEASATPLEDLKSRQVAEGDAGLQEPIEVGDAPLEQLIEFTAKAPISTYFVGRENELSAILNWLESQTYKIVIIHGIAGIGKTTLASKVLTEIKPRKNVFWYKFHEWDTLRNLLAPLSEFFTQMHRRDLKTYLETKATLDLNEIANIMEEHLKDTNAVLFFDDFHKVSENQNITALFTLLRECLERVGGAKFVIATRRTISFYDRREVVVKKLIAEMPLKGLDEAGSKQLLKLRALKGVDDEPAFKSIYNITQGHPLSLELIDTMDSINKLQDLKNVNLYIEEEIFLKLTTEEKKILQIASLHRYSTDLEGLLIYSELSYDVLANLAKKSLLEESAEGYEVHEIIKDFFTTHLSPELKKEFHAKIGEYYLTQLNKIVGLTEKCRAALETQFHFLRAGKQEPLVEVAIEYGPELIEHGYFEEFFDVLTKLEINKFAQKYWFEINILKGDILNVIGQHPSALEHYEKALSHPEAELTTNELRLAELYRKIGHVNEKMSNWNKAIENLDKSLKHSERCGDIKGVTDAYGGLGWVHWKKKEYELANQYYNKCMRNAELLEDLPGKAKIYMGLGISSAQQGNLEDAIKYYEKCISVLERNEDIYKIARMYDNLGDHYLKTIFSYYVKK